MSNASGEGIGFPPLLSSVRLAQGLETTPFPLPAVSSQAFVALPVHREVDAGHSMRGGGSGDNFRKKSCKLLLVRDYFHARTTHSVVIPAQAGTQYAPALGHFR